MRLQDKRILVTGSSSGVGLEIAKRYISEGAIVALHSHLRREQCPELNEAHFSGCEFFQQDLTKLDELSDYIDLVWSSLGGIDVIVNNAGTYNEPEFLELNIDTLQVIHTLNFFAPVILTRAWAKRCLADGIKGKAICTSSINAKLSEPCHVAYDSSKAALEGFVRSSAVDLAKHGIVINAIALGLVYTPLTAPFIDSTGIREQLDRAILLGVTMPKELTGMYVHLASDDSMATTGAVFAVDGGLSASQSTITVGQETA